MKALVFTLILAVCSSSYAEDKCGKVQSIVTDLNTRIERYDVVVGGIGFSFTKDDMKLIELAFITGREVCLLNGTLTYNYQDTNNGTSVHFGGFKQISIK